MERRFLDGRRILVVEDEFLIAEILVDILAEEGATVLGPIGHLDEALAYVREDGTSLDGALLDVNLHRRMSYPIATALSERGVPVVFVSGYGEASFDPAFRHYPRCAKPLQSRDILAALQTVLGGVAL